MPDLRIRAGIENSLVVKQNGEIDTSQVSKQEAEKLIAQISASLISSKGTARSGYLKLHVGADGEMRFSTGHWSRGAKANAAKLILNLARKAWGENSVDTKALEKYLRAPDRREGQDIAEGSRKVGTRSLLKLVSNRHDAYNSSDYAYEKDSESPQAILNQKPKTEPVFDGRKDEPVKTLQTYAYRFLKDAAARAPTARIQLNDNAGEIRRSHRINLLIHQTLKDYAARNGIDLSTADRSEVDQQRLAAMQALDSKVFGADRSGKVVNNGELQITPTGSESFNLMVEAKKLGLPVGRWTPNPKSPSPMPVLREGYEAELTRRLNASPTLDQRLEALQELQAKYREHLLASADQIESLASEYRRQVGEAKPVLADAESFGRSITAYIALGKILEFSKSGVGKFQVDLVFQDMPRPLDYALIGVSGVDALNFGLVNQAVSRLGEHLKPDGDPHPVKLIQDAVNEINRRVMGRNVDKLR